MRAIGRILIAVFVLLGQTGLVKAYVPCPVVETFKAVCSMKSKACCGCCQAKTEQNTARKCLMDDSGNRTSQATLTSADIPIPAAILPVKLPVAISKPVAVFAFTRPHLVVPHIRTPDIADNPLRAPPSC